VARRSWLLIGSGALVGVLAALALGVATASGDDTGPPVSTVGPIVQGSPGVGKTMKVTNGSWSTSATFTYQWVRCDAHDAGCANIPDATAATYVPVAADVGHFLGAQVTATNAAGSASVLSSGNGPVEAKPPGVRHKPWIGGRKKVGQQIYETGTRWSRSPYMFRDRWLRCSAQGDSCVPIKGKVRPCSSRIPVKNGVGPQYKLTKRDLGHRLRVRVTAWNGAGPTISTSDPTRIVRK
jgi:hypothetical protein